MAQHTFTLTEFYSLITPAKNVFLLQNYPRVVVLTALQEYELFFFFGKGKHRHITWLQIINKVKVVFARRI